ncbi:MAG: GTPase Era [Eubacteriales bacterium]|nr:GTPase Era [Eubacteriales bacterium]
MRENAYRSGFISIIGSPNVGKSTLMNRMVGQKVSIVSERAQTTRNRIMGVVTRKDCQMVFLDTPGVTSPKNRLGEYMLKVAYESLNEVEAILFVTDVKQGVREKDEALISKLRDAKAPVVAVLNKTDGATLDQVESVRERLERESFIKDIRKVSALTGAGVDALIDTLTGYLVPGPQYFPEDMVTDQPERVVCCELIREKALLLLKEEIPHGLGVDIEKMALRKEDNLYDIWATLYCERESHKPIVIGKKGSMLKSIGTEARKDMEWLLGTRVNLQLWVKVREDWRNSPAALKTLGYE